MLNFLKTAAEEILVPAFGRVILFVATNGEPYYKDDAGVVHALAGTDGTDGTDGKSAYQLWLDAGNTGTEADFLNSLKGTNGQGVPVGGTVGMALVKLSSTDYDTAWSGVVDLTTIQAVGGLKTFTDGLQVPNAAYYRLGVAGAVAYGTSAGTAVIAASTAGGSVILLRPSGPNATNGQVQLNPDGSMTWSGNAAAMTATRLSLGAVGLTGDETIAGAKTFSARPVLSVAANITADQTLQWVSGAAVVGGVRGASGGSMIVSGSGGTMFWRPNGDSSGTGQVSLRNDGAMIWSATGKPMADTRESLLAVGSTPSGASGSAGNWNKFATVDYTGSGTNHLQLLFAMMNYGVRATSGTIVSVSIRPLSNANIQSSGLRVEILGGGALIDPGQFMATVDYTTGVATVSLWVRKNSDFDRPYFYELTRMQSSATQFVVTYLGGSVWQAETPTGSTVITSTAPLGSAANINADNSITFNGNSSARAATRASLGAPSLSDVTIGDSVLPDPSFATWGATSAVEDGFPIITTTAEYGANSPLFEVGVGDVIDVYMEMRANVPMAWLRPVISAQSPTTTNLQVANGELVNTPVVGKWYPGRLTMTVTAAGANAAYLTMRRPSGSLSASYRRARVVKRSPVDVSLMARMPPVDLLQLGYLDNPPNIQNAAYTFALADRGYQVQKVTAGSVAYTIPADASVAFPVGTIINAAALDVAGGLTIVPAAGVTLYVSGARGTTGTRTLAAGAFVSLTKMAANLWSISGSGIT